MLDYSKYHPAMIALTENGFAFIYWVNRTLVAMDELNYGRGKYHWFEYLGKKTKEECRRLYPSTPILPVEDNRINKFCQGKIRDLEALVME